MHTAQSMHSSGSMVRKFGPSRKQSTGQTSTQSVYLQRMQDSVTTWVIGSRLGGQAGPQHGFYRDRQIPARHRGAPGPGDTPRAARPLARSPEGAAIAARATAPNWFRAAVPQVDWSRAPPA